jgi:hypothetical protein
VRFAFNFFDFPLTTSTVCGLTKETKLGEPRLLVPATSGGNESRNAGDAWFRFRVDSAVGNGSGDGGDENTTNIATDDESNGPHRRDSFIKYLHSGTPVMVDVFHGDSLLQKGVCALDIRSLLRKGTALGLSPNPGRLFACARLTLFLYIQRNGHHGHFGGSAHVRPLRDERFRI